MKACRMLPFLLVVLFPQFIFAQVCRQGESAVACFNRQVTVTPQQNAVLAEGIDASAVGFAALMPGVRAGTNYKLATESTGPQTTGVGRAASTKDFVSDFIAFLESGGAGNRVGDTLTFQWNVPFVMVSTSKKLNFNLSLKDPKIDPKVGSEIAKLPQPATINVDDLTGSLDQRDDVTFGTAWSFNRPESSRNTDAVIKEQMAILQSSVGPGLVADLKTLKKTQADRIELMHIDVNDTATINSIVSTAVRETQETEMQLVRSRLDWLADLGAQAANEKPQFWGEAHYHYRNSLIGAKELGASFNLEIAMKTSATTALRTAFRDPQTALRLSANEDTPPATAEPAKPRFTFKGSYTQVERRTLAQPSLGSLNRAASHVLSLAAVAGWNFSTIDSARKASFDLNATFENDSSDKTKKDRLIASAAFSQKLNDHFSLPITLVYATHERDLGDVTKRFSARFGVSYKIVPTAEKTVTEAARNFARQQ